MNICGCFITLTHRHFAVVLSVYRSPSIPFSFQFLNFAVMLSSRGAFNLYLLVSENVTNEYLNLMVDFQSIQHIKIQIEFVIHQQP